MKGADDKRGRVDLHETLRQTPQHVQRQDGLLNQLRDLIPFANKLGLYDAADFLTKTAETLGQERT
jgi:hypothetical protein